MPGPPKRHECAQGVLLPLIIEVTRAALVGSTVNVCVYAGLKVIVAAF